MKKKDIKLFDKAIHNAKAVLDGITQERNLYHKEVSELRKQQTTLRYKHDKKMKKLTNKCKKIINELYELFDDLSGKEGR